MPYAEDSLWTLGPAARAGVLLLSGAMAAALLAAMRRVPGPAAARGAAALLAGWGFVWLSPQAYYLYYLAVLDGLPWQVVVGAPPGPGEVLRLGAFAGRATLSAHGQGALLWALVAAALARR